MAASPDGDRRFEPAGRRLRDRDRQPFGVGQTVTQASSRRWPAPRSARPITSSSSRPTRRSIRAIRAGRWSTSMAASSHQHGDLLAIRRQPRHRLRHPRQHGQGGGGDRQGRRPHGAPALARRAPPARDPGHRRQRRPRPSDRGAGGLDAAQEPGRGGRTEARRRGPGGGRSDRRRPGGLRLPLRPQGHQGETKLTVLRGATRTTVPVRLGPAPETRRATP